MTMTRSWAGAIAASLWVFGCTPGTTEPSESVNSVNLYTARHYASDDNMLKAFTETTGITVNTRKGDPTSLLEILKAEGENSPADIIIAGDAGTLWKFQDAGLTAPVDDEELNALIPVNLRQAEGHWFGLSKRYRVIAFDKAKYTVEDFKTYSDLTNESYKGQVCVRPSSNIYNLSLLADLVAALGEEQATEWVKGVVANFARNPRGGDRTQIRGIASGECGIAIVNHYYWLRMLATQEGQDFDAAQKVGLAFAKISDAAPWTHTNVTAIAMAKKAPNREAALTLMRYLAAGSGQQDLIAETYEMPIDQAIPRASVYQHIPQFTESTQSLQVYGQRQKQAQQIYLKEGWE